MIPFGMRIMYQLKSEELAEVERAIRQEKRSEVRQQATVVIRLLHLGHKPGAVAERQMVSIPTIYHWHQLWRKKGLEGPANQSKTGPPPKAVAAHCQKLEEVLEQALRYRFALWTSDRLRAQRDFLFVSCFRV